MNFWSPFTAARCLCSMLAVACLGCSGQVDPSIQAAGEQVVKLGGKFIPSGATIPVKSADKMPTGNWNIRSVELNQSHVRDQEFEPLKALVKLEELSVQSSYLTDAGITMISELKNLRTLDLHKSQYFTDKGIAALKALPSLTKLELSYTRVTDGAIESLTELKGLKTIHLTGTRISADGLARLKAALPNCQVLK